METGLIIIAIVLVIACLVLVGYLFVRKNVSPQQEPKGILHVNCQDASRNPELFLALTVPVEDVMSKKQILLDVNVIRENSQK